MISQENAIVDIDINFFYTRGITIVVRNYLRTQIDLWTLRDFLFPACVYALFSIFSREIRSTAESLWEKI